MSSKVARKLRRELTANPKKAGALVVMLLVAMWFWAPLLNDWFGGPSTPAAPTSSNAPVTAITTASTEAPKTESAKAPKLTWQELAARLEADPLMRPSDVEIARDPFHPVAALEPEQKPVEAAVVEQPVITPVEAGLSLTSTMVGSQRRVARVLGKTYQVGDRISGETKEGKDIEFVVAEIHSRRIVLERDGRQFELKLPVGRLGVTSPPGQANATTAAEPSTESPAAETN